MNNINIKNIFGINDTSKIFDIKVFNSIDLVKTNLKTNVTDDFIIDKIKTNIKIEEIKINELYDKKYDDCLSKINDAIDIGLTDICYKLTKKLFGYKTYNPKICLELIQTKLREKKFETFIYSDTDIFISWKNVY
jgi:hypothetical protein